MNKQEQLLKICGLRIICVLILHSLDFKNSCTYRVYTSDGGFSDYRGYCNLPQFVKDWLEVRNSFDYALSGCIFVSGVPLSGSVQGVEE